ncbi:MAG: hypothetical protein ABIN97_14275 [Ginsengibacter sp.]
MKKLFMVFAIAAVLSACGDGTSTETTVTNDSSMIGTPATGDTSNMMSGDSSSMMMSGDSSKMMMSDSAR